MKAATTDLGMFEIMVRACRRIADQGHLTFDQHEVIGDLLLDTYSKITSSHTTRTRHERSDYDVFSRRNYEPRWKDQDRANQILRNARFDLSEVGVIYMHVIRSGALSLVTTEEVNRAIRKLYDMSYGDDCVEDLISNDVIRVCDDCGSYEWCDDMSSPDDYNSVCRACIESNYVWSEYEDCYIHVDQCRNALDEDGNDVTIHEDNSDFRWDEDEDTYVHVDYEGGSGRIFRGYHSSKGSHRPIVSDWTRRNGPFFMGCELEVEVKKGKVIDKVEQLHPVLNQGGDVGQRVFFEEDGSLSYGFEIITQPMGLDMHEAFWQWVNNPELRRNLVSHNSSTCGFHVHLSKRPLTQLQINKMITFVNHPDNEPLIRAVARRYGQNYARIKEKKLSSAHKSEDRYEAINVTNTHTIEFRIFRGSLKYETLMAAVEFVNALRNFTSPASGVGFDLSQDKFLEYIHEGPVYTETKHLRPYIETRLERN